MYGYPDIRAHVRWPGRYLGLLSLIINYDAANYFAEWNELRRRLVDFLNVRCIVATPNAVLPPRYRMFCDGVDGRIFENPDALPRFYAARNVILEGMRRHRLGSLWRRWKTEKEEQRGGASNRRPGRRAHGHHGKSSRPRPPNTACTSRRRGLR